MRNLKKFLALVLAMMMVMGLMVTANAATVKTDAPITADYQLAVDVLFELGVLKGGTGGIYHPQDTISRAEFAMMLFRIATGETNDKKSLEYANLATFSDVPSNYWAAGAIGFCETNGLLRGVGGNRYNPEGMVNGYSVLAGLLRAVGYDQNGEYKGSNWQVMVARDAQTTGLRDSILPTVVLSADATRETVAQLFFTTLTELSPVTYGDGGKYETNASGTDTNQNGNPPSLGEIMFNMEVTRIGDPRTFNADGTVNTRYTSGSQLVADFDLVAEPFGRPGPESVLTVGGKVMYVEYPEPTYTFVIDTDPAADAAYTKSGDTDPSATVEGLLAAKKLGSSKVDVSAAPGSTQKGYAIARGDVVELYVDKDTHKLTDTIIYRYKGYTIKSVKAVDAEADADAVELGASYIVELDGLGVVYDIQLANFDAETYVKGAVVAVAQTRANSDPETAYTDVSETTTLADLTPLHDALYVDSYVAGTVTGKVAARDGKNNYIRVAGGQYTTQMNASTFEVGDTGTFYLDKNNTVIKAEMDDEVADLSDVFYVIAQYTTESFNKYGEQKGYHYAQVVYADGTQTDYLVGTAGTAVAAQSVGNARVGSLATAEYDSANGVYVITAGLPEELTTGENRYYDGTIITGTTLKSSDTTVAAAKWSGDSVLRLEGTTQYVVIKGEGKSDLTLKATVGGADATTTGNSPVIYHVNETGSLVADAVFVIGTPNAAQPVYDDVLYVDGNAKFEKVILDDDTVAYKYNAYALDGTVMEILANNTPSAYAGFRAYSIDENTGVYKLGAIAAVAVANADHVTYKDETGSVTGFFKSLYTSKVTVADGYGADLIVDLVAGDATVLDLHDKSTTGNSGKNYTGTVYDLSRMAELKKDGYAIGMTVYADKGAVLIVVTDVVKGTAEVHATVTFDLRAWIPDEFDPSDELTVTIGTSNEWTVSYSNEEDMEELVSGLTGGTGWTLSYENGYLIATKTANAASETALEGQLPDVMTIAGKLGGETLSTAYIVGEFTDGAADSSKAKVEFTITDGTAAAGDSITITIGSVSGTKKHGDDSKTTLQDIIEAIDLGEDWDTITYTSATGKVTVTYKENGSIDEPTVMRISGKVAGEALKTDVLFGTFGSTIIINTGA